jgi:tripartite-type tricarboxylate transporter receptor subunit TctC
MIESGIPDFHLVAWVGLFAPAGTPRDVVLVLNQAIKAMVEKPDVKDRLNTLGSEVHTNSPEEFGGYVKTAIRTWGEKIREAGIQPE